MNYLFNLFLGEEAFLLSEKKKKKREKKERIQNKPIHYFELYL